MASVREDLEGVVTAYDAAGVPVTLSAGDDIPEGVEVGEHVLADGEQVEEVKDEGDADKVPTEPVTEVDTTQDEGDADKVPTRPAKK